MGDTAVSLGGSALQGLLGGLGGGGSSRGGVLSQQPNKWWEYYQDLLPMMQTNALMALGDPSAMGLMRGKYAGMANNAYGSSPFGYNMSRSGSGYSSGDTGNPGNPMGFMQTGAPISAPSQAPVARPSSPGFILGGGGRIVPLRR